MATHHAIDGGEGHRRHFGGDVEKLVDLGLAAEAEPQHVQFVLVIDAGAGQRPHAGLIVPVDVAGTGRGGVVHAVGAGGIVPVIVADKAADPTALAIAESVPAEVGTTIAERAIDDGSAAVGIGILTIDRRGIAGPALGVGPGRVVLDADMGFDRMGVVAFLEGHRPEAEALAAPGIPVAQTGLDMDAVVLVAHLGPILGLGRVGAAIDLFGRPVLAPISGQGRAADCGSENGKTGGQTDGHRKLRKQTRTSYSCPVRVNVPLNGLANCNGSGDKLAHVYNLISIVGFSTTTREACRTRLQPSARQ